MSPGDYTEDTLAQQTTAKYLQKDRLGIGACLE